MAESNTTLCPQCGRPIKKDGAGSITQWISACRCKERLVPETAAIEICRVCKKRVSKGRDGSMTQWVLRGDLCTCRPDPGKTEASSDKTSSTAPVSADTISSNEPELDLSPESFPRDRYKPIAEIGRGAAGIVYLCRDRLLKKKVAVKVLRSVTAHELVNFQREAKATSQLHHACVVAVLDFGSTASGAPFMVMEYVRGINLEQYHKAHGVLPWEQAARIFIELTDALDAAHKRDIFHRDLKSSNILITGESTDANEVKIIDFGVATVKHATQEPTIVQGNTIVGTPAYMPPDQVKGLPYDARSEVYSLGCVFFESLTGRVPFEAETALETIAKHVNDPVPQLVELLDESFPEDLQMVIDKCLSKDPAQRFQSMVEVREALKDLCFDTKDSQTAPPSTVPRGGSAIWAVASLIILAFVALAAFCAVESGSFAKLKNEEKNANSVVDANESYHLEERARIQMEDGRYEQALETVEKSIELDRYNLRALDTRGLAYFLTGNPARARADFTKVLSSSSDQETLAAASFHLELLNRSKGKSAVKIPSSGYYNPTSWELKKFAPLLSEDEHFAAPLSKTASNVSQIGSTISILSGTDEDLIFRINKKEKCRSLIFHGGAYTKAGLQRLKRWPIRNLTLHGVACSEEALLSLFPLPELKSIEIKQAKLSNRFLRTLAANPILILSLTDCTFEARPFVALKNAKSLGAVEIIRCYPFDGSEWLDLPTRGIWSVTWVPPESSTSTTRTYPSKYLNVLCQRPDLEHLNLDAGALDDSNVNLLRGAENLRVLSLTRAKCLSESCMSELCKITHLTSLSLSGEISSAKVILQIRAKKLQMLEIENMVLDSATAYALSRLNVEKLYLGVSAGDPKLIRYLARNKSFREIQISGDIVPPEEILNLRSAMPHCKVERNSYSTPPIE